MLSFNRCSNTYGLRDQRLRLTAIVQLSWSNKGGCCVHDTSCSSHKLWIYSAKLFAQSKLRWIMTDAKCKRQRGEFRGAFNSLARFGYLENCGVPAKRPNSFANSLSPFRFTLINYFFRAWSLKQSCARDDNLAAILFLLSLSVRRTCGANFRLCGATESPKCVVIMTNS